MLSDVSSEKSATASAGSLRSGKSDSVKAMEKEAARIRWLLAINPNTPAPVLDHLARDASPVLLERIAENPRTHAGTLARLASHENAQVRAAVAENVNVSMKTMWILAKDSSADVRMRLAESYMVPLAVLRILATDDNPYVQSRAVKTLGRLQQDVGPVRIARTRRADA